MPYCQLHDFSRHVSQDLSVVQPEPQHWLLWKIKPRREQHSEHRPTRRHAADDPWVPEQLQVFQWQAHHPYRWINCLRGVLEHPLGDTERHLSQWGIIVSESLHREWHASFWSVHVPRWVRTNLHGLPAHPYCRTNWHFETALALKESEDICYPLLLDGSYKAHYLRTYLW